MKNRIRSISPATVLAGIALFVVQRVGGVDARRYVKNVRRVHTQTPSDPGTPKSAPPRAVPPASA